MFIRCGLTEFVLSFSSKGPAWFVKLNKIIIIIIIIINNNNNNSNSNININNNNKSSCF